MRSEQSPMPVYYKYMKKLIIATCVGLAVAASACSKPDHTDLYRQIQSADRIVFASMAITKTAKLENSDWYKLGKRIAVYSYNSYMHAYIDLSEIGPGDIQFDEDNKTVRLVLPPVRTEVSGRDMQMRKEYENIGMMRSDLDSKERAMIKENANRSFKAEVEDNPEFIQRLQQAAQRKARKYFENLFQTEGYTPQIEFKKQ